MNDVLKNAKTIDQQMKPLNDLDKNLLSEVKTQKASFM